MKNSVTISQVTGLNYHSILHMLTLIKYSCCLMLFILCNKAVYSQCFTSKELFNKVIAIDKDTIASDEKKLHSLYSLKNNLEQCHQAHDSAYVITLIKIAKYCYQKNNDSAISFSTRALQINKSLAKSVDNKIIINACFNLAGYYRYSLQQTKALLFYDTVITLCRISDFEDYLTESRFRRAEMYSALGDHQKVIEESTLGIAEALQRNDTAHYIMLLNQRADGLMKQSYLTEALKDLETAIPIEKQANDDYWLATSYNKIGLICQRQNEFKKAESYLLKTNKIRPQLVKYMLTIASDYNDIGNLYLTQPGRTAEAKKSYFKVINYADKCDPSSKGLLSLMAFENLAEAYRLEHNNKMAIYYYTMACNQLHLKTKDFLFSNFTAAQLAVVEYRDLLFSLLFGKTSFLLQLYKETHEPKYLNACIESATLTDLLLTKTRHETLNDNSKLFWRNEAKSFFTNTIEACYLSNDADKAFYFMERSRAVLLNDKWNELSANSHLPNEEAAKEQMLQSKILEQKKHLSSLESSSVQYRKMRDSLLQSKDDLEHFIKSLEKNYPVYYRHKYVDDMLSLSALQKQLDRSKSSFVYYYVNDSAIYALGLSKTRNTFIKVTKDNFDNRQLTRFMQLCSNKKELNQNYPEFSFLAQNIYNKIFRPLQLPKGNVAVCTDNFFIPFEALCKDKKGKDFLLKEYAFNYVYSARSLLIPFVGRRKPSGNFAGFAPVSFSPELNVLPLINSLGALNEASQYYSNPVLFTQQKSSRKNFFEQAAEYSVVTIFSHAQADTTSREPVLYMQDSLIPLSELQRLNKPAIQFVLLSACQTNIGRNASGEGIFSLARGFAAAGIPSVSATLWNADEETIYSISTKFNEYLAKGMNKSDALQQVKLWYLQNCDREHALPFYWANMVLIGSSDPIMFTKTERSWPWIAIPAFLLIIVATFLVYIYKKKQQKRVF